MPLTQYGPDYSRVNTSPTPEKKEALSRKGEAIFRIQEAINETEEGDRPKVDDADLEHFYDGEYVTTDNKGEMWLVFRDNDGAPRLVNRECEREIERERILAALNGSGNVYPGNRMRLFKDGKKIGTAEGEEWHVNYQPGTGIPGINNKEGVKKRVSSRIIHTINEELTNEKLVKFETPVTTKDMRLEELVDPDDMRIFKHKESIGKDNHGNKWCIFYIDNDPVYMKEEIYLEQECKERIKKAINAGKEPDASDIEYFDSEEYVTTDDMGIRWFVFYYGGNCPTLISEQKLLENLEESD